MASAFDYSQDPATDQVPNDSTREVMQKIAGAFAVYTAGGTANAQTVTLDPALDAYSTKVRIAFIPVADNTGSATLNVNSLGAKTIKTQDGNNLWAGALDSSGVSVVQYDGTNFVLISTPGISESGANGNGEYVRFADGTQYCWRTISLDVGSTSSQTYSLPKNFSTSYPRFGMVSGETSAGTASIREAVGSANVTVSDTQWTVRVSVAHSSSTNRTVDVFAMGRWK